MACSALLAAIIVVLLANAQEGPGAPLFYMVYPEYRYAHPVARLREVDFRNTTVHVFDKEEKIELSAHLIDGRFEETISLAGMSFREWVGLESVHYLDLQDGEPRQAVVISTWVSTGVSSSSYGVVQLLEVPAGQLTLSQQIFFSKEDGGASYDPSTETLTIRVSDCHWCEGKLVVLKWSKGVFLKESEEAVPAPSQHPQ